MCRDCGWDKGRCTCNSAKKAASSSNFPPIPIEKLLEELLPKLQEKLAETVREVVKDANEHLRLEIAQLQEYNVALAQGIWSADQGEGKWCAGQAH